MKVWVLARWEEDGRKFVEGPYFHSVHFSAEDAIEEHIAAVNTVEGRAVFGFIVVAAPEHKPRTATEAKPLSAGEVLELAARAHDPLDEWRVRPDPAKIELEKRRKARG